MPPLPLPVFAAPPVVGPADLVRLFHRSQLIWSRGVAEEVAVDGGTWLHNRDLQPLPTANCVLDAALDPGQPVEAWVRRLEAATAGCPVRGWTLNPSLPAERTAALADHLARGGRQATTLDVLHLARQRPAPAAADGLTVLPTRAALGPFRRLMVDLHGPGPAADAAELHLDDPHLDAYLALRDGVAVATVGLLNAGDVGSVRDLYVAPPERGRGTGRTMLARALEAAGRSGHRHVLAGVPPAATGLFAAAGFRVVGQWVQYV